MHWLLYNEKNGLSDIAVLVVYMIQVGWVISYIYIAIFEMLSFLFETVGENQS